LLALDSGLLHHILPKLKEDCLFLSGEDRTVQPWLASQSIEKLRENIGRKKILIIDEAQKVPEIGLNLNLHSAGNRLSRRKRGQTLWV